MKRKLRFALIIVGVLFICFSFGLRTNAQNIQVVDEFEDISFTTIPVLTSDKKSKCIVTWKTNAEVKYLKVLLKLQNNKEQIPYASDRQNTSGTFTSKKTIGDKYLNVLEIEVDNSQLGNIKIKFDYSYEMILGDASDDIKTFTYIFVTGKWVKNANSFLQNYCFLYISKQIFLALTVQDIEVIIILTTK